MAGGLADFVFVISTVDVNIPLVCVRICCFQPIQPKNPRHYEIIGFQHCGRRPERDATFVCDVDWLTRPDFLSNAEATGRRLETSFHAAEPKLRRRDWKGKFSFAVPLQTQALARNRNVNGWLSAFLHHE